jgi:hypothetical protein
MFREILSHINKIERFDRILNTSGLKVGEVETPGGATQLAFRLPSDEVVTMEPRAQAQLLSNWRVPAEHFDRLPRELQAAELTHFATRQPKELTFRAVTQPGGAIPAIRAALSGKYTPFDNAEVLETVTPHVEGYELARPDVQRDEMAIVLVRPEAHDVSKRQVGDLVKTGITIRNSEIGTMSLGVDFTAWRLACLNGMIRPTSEVTVRQRHIWIDRKSFAIQLRHAVMQAHELGMAIVHGLRAAHDFALPNLDPDEGKLQREIVGLLRREGLYNRDFAREVSEVVGVKEEGSVFGLIQFLTGDYAKRAEMSERMARERVAGRILDFVAA